MASPLTYETFRLRNRMPVLDGVRACAVLGVVIHHSGSAALGRLHGFRGVSVFFVLSGFLITTLALREEARSGFLNLRAFAIRRVFRIMPLFYLALVTYVLWVCTLHMEEKGELLLRYLPSYLLYCPEFPIFRYHFTVPFAQAWSLGIEEKFYLAWPLLAFWALARSKHRVSVTVALLAAALGLTAANGPLAQMWGSYADILMGCLLGLLMHERRAFDSLRVLGRTEITAAILALLAVAALSRLTGTQLGERYFALLVAAAITALVTNGGAVAAAVGNRYLALLGAWSYAMYLVHPIVIDSWTRVLPAGRLGVELTLPLTLAVALPICWFLHVRVEKPFIELGRRVTSRIAVARPTATLHSSQTSAQ